MALMGDLDGRGRLLAALGVIAVAFVAVNVAGGLVATVTGPLLSNADLVIGLGLIGLLGWWVVSEADEGDSAADAIGKTADRAEDATDGFLEGTAAVILGGSAILLTVGQQVLDLAGIAPTVASNLLAVGLGFLGIAGVVSSTQFVAIALIALVVAVAIRRRDG